MGLTTEPSVLSSQGSVAATDLSRKTDRTSYSVPDDGRAITIQTNRRKKKDTDGASNLSQATNTSLLIEYFENGKTSPGGSGHRPSVRVKVTPSAAKRHRVKANADGKGLEISDVGSRPGSRQHSRQPTHTQRITLSPGGVSEDRLIMGENSNSNNNNNNSHNSHNRTRSLSGGHSTLSSYTSGGDDSNIGHHYPLNVTVIREAGSPSSMHSSARDFDGPEITYRNRRQSRQRRSSHSKSAQTDTFYENDLLKGPKGPRSRSVSRETDVSMENGLKAPKLGRRRSRSLSRERVAMSKVEKELIEKGVMETLEKLSLPKPRKQRSRSGSRTNDDGMRTPRRNGSRDQETDSIAAEKARLHRRKESHVDDGASLKHGTTAITNNPAVLDAIEDAIKRLILPQLNELKSNQNVSKFESLSSPPQSVLGRQYTKRVGKSSSMPDVGKPMVVLSPDMEQGHGLGVVISGGPESSHVSEVAQEVLPLQIRRERGRNIDSGLADSISEKSEVSYTRAPGLGPIHSPLHSEADGEGVSLVDVMPVNGTGGQNRRLEMPDGPERMDTPETYAETRASILTDRSGLPYPASSRESGMPISGMTPPPAGFRGGRRSRSSSASSDRTAGRGGYSTLSKPGDTGPSILSLALGDMDDKVDENDNVTNVSSRSGHSNGAPTTIRPGASLISINTMTSTQSTKLARQRRKGKGREEQMMSEIHEGDYAQSQSNGDPRNNVVESFFADQRERAQERALLDPNLRDSTIEARHVSTHTESSFEARHLEKVASGHQVFMLGANPSMRSTPVAAGSVQASVLDPSVLGHSNLDGDSDVSYRTNDHPQMGSSAMPLAHDPMPEIGHLGHDDDEDDINTNPSIIQGPISHQETWQFDPTTQTSNDHHMNSDRDLDLEDVEPLGGLLPSAHSSSHGVPPTPPLKDEGYMSAVNPGIISPGPRTPVQQMRGDPTMGMGGIDDILSDGEYSPYRRHNGGHVRDGMGSGNSHGMPSPLYDSSTGRGIDRIQSKDIVALMDHLTVRDAQRNARDTEILVTLVRSAAEMRNSFEDMKKTLEEQQRNIISGVDENTERSVQKIIQGPRPQPPSAPRMPRYSGPEDGGDDEGPAKRRNVFKRALKGLSMRSSSDLQRIEDMLHTLLTDVEGLKGGQEFYQQSLLQSQSLGTFDAMKALQDTQQPVDPANSSNTNSGYYSGVPIRQPSGSRIYPEDRPRQSTQISPIQEDAVLNTPPREIRGGSLPLETPPEARGLAPAALSNGNTPTKSEKHKRESGSSSIFPKISRWSETTASSGMRFLGGRKKTIEGSEASHSQSNLDFWEVEAKNHQPDHFQAQSPLSDGQRTPRPTSPLLPPSSRGTDAPMNQSNRISLDIQHPQPRLAYCHRLEAQAQQLAAAQGINPNSPTYANQSTSSLGTFPPLGPGGFTANGKLMSPLAQDAYLQHQQQQQQQEKHEQEQQEQSADAPPRPPKVKEDDDTEEMTTPEKSRNKERRGSSRDETGEKPRKHRTEEEKARRKEKKERKERRERESGVSSSASRKKSRDLLSTDGGYEGTASPFSGRSPSTASRLNGPRPLSSNSNKENSRRHRHHGSHTTNEDTFGYGPEYDGYGTLR